MTLGLASQLYSSDDGTRLMRVRAGQIHYFEDRRVSLNGTVDDAERSDMIAELDLWPNPRTRVSARLVRDQESGEYDDRELSMSYRNAGLVANFGYYFTEEELEQTLASLVYPLDERWTLVAKYHQSRRFDKPVDHLLGFGFKMLYGESGEEDEDFAETDYRIYFELTLKGLTDAGQDIDLQLGESIPGYQPAF